MRQNQCYVAMLAVIEALNAFEFIDIHFINYDQCQDYRSMAMESEKYVIVSIVKHEIYIGKSCILLNCKFHMMLVSLTLIFIFSLFVMAIFELSLYLSWAYSCSL